MVRSCVVCRQTEEKQKLLRFVLQAVGDPTAGREPVAADKVVVLDVESCMPGRGAYCHSAIGCLGAPKVEALLVASLVRTAKQRGESISTRFRGVDVVVGEALRHSDLRGAAKESLQRIVNEVRSASDNKRIGKPGRVRL